MSEFRVSVCLTRFYNDERSYCYVYLDKAYNTIASFEHYLRRQFRLPNPFCLMTGNNLLPSDQTTKIILPGDVITVVPLKKDWHSEEEAVLDTHRNVEVENGTTDAIDGLEVGCEKISKKKKKKKTKPETAEVSTSHEDETFPSKKEQPVSLEHDAECEVNKKKDSDMDVSMGSDADKDMEQQPDDNDDGGIETDDQTTQNNNKSDMRTLEPHKISEMQLAIQQMKIKALSLLNEVAGQKPVAGVSGGRINKRKRIRKRNKNPSLSVSTPDLSDSSPSPPLSFKPIKKSASHIRFHNELSPTIQDGVRNSESVTKPRIIHAIETVPISTSCRTSVCGSPNSEIACSSNSNIYPTTDSPLNGNSNNRDTLAQKEPEMTIEKVKNRLREFPVMDNGYPAVKDLILFKMLKIGNDYTPTISDYILARVMEVDKPNGIVKVSVEDGHKECRPTLGKFDLEPANKTQTTDDLLEVSWSQVTAPRLIFP